jgi:hypothetical protein
MYASYVGNKWGGIYLRAPEIFFKILENPKCSSLKELVLIIGGIITGENKKYYKLLENNYIPPGYEPCFKSPKEIKTIKVSKNDCLFVIKNNNVPYKIKKANLLWPDLRNDVHVVHLNEDLCAFEHNFYGLKPLLLQDSLKLSLILNSTLSAFMFEIFSRTNLGGGAGRLVKLDIKKFLVIKPNFLNISYFKYLDTFINREIKSIFEELGFKKCAQKNCKHSEHPYEYVKPEEVSFDKIMLDRRELDRIIFEAIGLTEEEQLEVYRTVVELVKNRLLKAKRV